MNCAECRPLLHEYFAGGLTPAQHAEIERHEASCASCRGLMETAREITCRGVAEFLHEYFEGELPVGRREVFERHLSICRECREYLASYRATVRMGKRAMTAGELAVDVQVPERLVQAILDARRRAPD